LASRWRRLRLTRAWAEALGLRPEQAPELRPERVVAAQELAGAALELRPEQAAAGRELAEAGALGAAEQLIARMVKRNLRSALGVWF
jgi:hypothetical protein